MHLKTRDVLPFAEIGESDADMVGPKAFSLVKMSHLGLPVPIGFCITTSGYKNHIQDIEGFDRMVSSLAGSSAETASILSGIRQAILDKPFAEDLLGSIKTCCCRLGIATMAVRSSAIAEDLMHRSFAGQHETYLRIQTVKECGQAVKKCWASLWSERAYTYRQSAKMRGSDVRMAVIVQQMVDADASGVIFTANPVVGDTNRLVIEACYGTGDALVSGHVTPDRFIVDKATGTVTSQNLSEQMRTDTRPGIDQERKSATGVTQDPCIDSSTIRQLIDLAVTIEKYYQCPQDIEWAVCRSNVHILQSRAITTIQKEPCCEDRQVWTCVNTREVMPEAVTPATWSLMSDLLHSVLDMVLDMVGLERGASPGFGLVAGRCYGNLNTFIGIARKLPFVRNAKLSNIFGDTAPGGEAKKWLELATRNRAEVKWRFFNALLRLPVNILQAVTYTNRKVERMIEDLESWIQGLNEVNMEPLSSVEIVDQLMQSIEHLKRFILRARHGSIYGGMQIATFTLLRKACVRWLKEDESFANGLLIGVGGMADAQAGIDLWQLADMAGSSQQIKAIIMSGDTWERVSEKIKAAIEGNRFLDAWVDYMHMHGHHARGEFELYNARWHERPDYILSVVRSFISGLEQTDRMTVWKQRTEERQKLVQNCRQRLKNPLKSAIFDRLLARVQQFVVLRENSKNHVIRLSMFWRRMLLGLGDRMHADGVFKNRDDIFFLTFPEMRDIVAGSYIGDMENSIELRKSEYEGYRACTPPITVLGRFKPETAAPIGGYVTPDILNGLAVCPGIACGRAKVFCSVDDESNVLRGEILVAPFTDPGWTPYLVSASGIVVDQGGLLSHGSIIAREYGIPTVVNVGLATRVIRTGDLVQVDGNLGRVTILKRVSNQ